MTVVQALGLPFLPPSKALRRDFQQGANMAIIGGAVLDYTNASLKFTAYDGSMNTQIDNVQQLLPSISRIVNTVISGVQVTAKLYSSPSACKGLSFFTFGFMQAPACIPD